MRTRGRGSARASRRQLRGQLRVSFSITYGGSAALCHALPQSVQICELHWQSVPQSVIEWFAGLTRHVSHRRVAAVKGAEAAAAKEEAAAIREAEAIEDTRSAPSSPLMARAREAATQQDTDRCVARALLLASDSPLGSDGQEPNQPAQPAQLEQLLTPEREAK